MCLGKSVDKFKSIRSTIVSQERAFYYFIRDFVLDADSWKILNFLSSRDHVYVLSGVIRDYLTGDYSGARDFDCVLLNGHYKENEILQFLRHSKHRMNSFGGMKIKRAEDCIDIWRITDTWGIKKQHLEGTPESLLKTVFFNFSAIVYDFNNRKFIFDDDFCLFLKTKVMDVIYSENPNTPLCLINILYYHEKYRFDISLKLAKWIKAHYRQTMNFRTVQLNHFGKVLYTNEYIDSFFHHIP